MTFQGTTDHRPSEVPSAITPLGGGGACYDPNDLTGNTIPSIGYLAPILLPRLVAGPRCEGDHWTQQFSVSWFRVMNLSLGKTLKLTESTHLQLKADF